MGNGRGGGAAPSSTRTGAALRSPAPAAARPAGAQQDRSRKATRARYTAGRVAIAFDQRAISCDRSDACGTDSECSGVLVTS